MTTRERALTDPGTVSELQRNRILRALPPSEFARVASRLAIVPMKHGALLHGADEPIDRVYFPLTGCVSIIAETAEGDAVDVQIIGAEGVVGLPVFLRTHRMPMRVVVQIPGQAAWIGADPFRELLSEEGRLPELLLAYTQMVLVEISQTVLCNRSHPLRERTARWLLQIDERAHEAPFELTQEFFATMLGVHRPAVTVVAHDLRAEGLIDYARGRIEITDRVGLERTACDCYRLIRDELARLLSAETERSGPGT